MAHGPATDWGKDNAAGYKTRIGLIMFAIYGLVYAGFIFINAIKPQLMGTIIMFGVNLAIVYGFGLILLAIVFGLIYNALCTKKENELNTDNKGGAE